VTARKAAMARKTARREAKKVHQFAVAACTVLPPQMDESDVEEAEDDEEEEDEDWGEWDEENGEAADYEPGAGSEEEVSRHRVLSWR
jgi:hypothetical protein